VFCPLLSVIGGTLEKNNKQLTSLNQSRDVMRSAYKKHQDYLASLS